MTVAPIGNMVQQPPETPKSELFDCWLSTFANGSARCRIRALQSFVTEAAAENDAGRLLIARHELLASLQDEYDSLCLPPISTQDDAPLSGSIAYDDSVKGQLESMFSSVMLDAVFY